MLHTALPQLELDQIDLLIVENVGNLVCPVSFQLGTHRSILIASIPEGDDKPYKYPGMYRGVDALVINKIDLLPYVSFNMDFFRRGVEILNPGIETFPLSCRTGEGVEDWINWILEQVELKREERNVKREILPHESRVMLHEVSHLV
jgi:hydrogenase nickel incorporation protein HypB